MDAPNPLETPKVVFPYRSMAEAARDRYSKIGGPEQALRFMRHGFKTLHWRKNWSRRKRAKTRLQERLEDQAFAAENKRTLSTHR